MSTATDVDFDLLRMMVRLVLTRARALGLQPVESGDAVGNKGVGWGATGEVGSRSVVPGVTWCAKDGRKAEEFNSMGLRLARVGLISCGKFDGPGL